MKILTTAAMALAMPAMLATALPAQAATAYQSEAKSTETWNKHGRHDDRDQREWGGGQRYNTYQGGYYGQRQYNQRAYYDEPVSRNTRVWRGDDNRYYCRKSNGTTGLIIGGAAGALLGRQIAGRGDNTLGTILGGLGGALLGREVDRGGSRCR
ncbi:MAG: glycine zipper 2TM domain-containing protein [Novosphingobium sp.]